MKIEIVTAPDFDKASKRLKKRYRSLVNDLGVLEKDLLKNPNIGVDLGRGIHKIRLAIKSKGRGKSGGARVLTQQTVIIEVSGHVITLLTIYDKSEKDNITDKEISALLKKNGLI